MRTFWFLMMLFISISACTSKEHYHIKGHISGESDWVKNGLMVMANQDRNNHILDTVPIIDGRFEFRGTIKNPEMAIMMPIKDGIAKGRLFFFLENDRYVVSGVDSTFSFSEVRGGETNTLLREYSESVRNLNLKYDVRSIRQQLEAKLTPDYRRTALEALNSEYLSACTHLRDSMVSVHTPSYFSLEMTVRDIQRISDVDSLRDVMGKYLSNKNFAKDPRVIFILDHLAKTDSLKTVAQFTLE